MRQDLTEGNPFKQLLLFSLPIFIGNVFQQLYSMADTLIVGHTISSDAMSGVGCTNSITFLILGLVWGLTSGFAVRTSQFFGAKDENRLRKSIAVSFELCILMTVILTAIAVGLSGPLLRAMNTPQQYYDYAYYYLITIFWGIGATILYNIAANTLRAVGDSRTPLFCLIFSAILNVVLDFVCIVNFKMTYTGAGFATVVSQFISGAVCVIYMFKAYPSLRPKKSDWSFNSVMIKGHISVGLPMALQYSITALGCVFQQSALNGLSSALPGVVTGYTAASKIDNLTMQTMNSLGTASATYAGQNYGAKKFGRIKDGVFAAMVLAVISWGISFAFCMGLGNPITKLFLNGSTGEAALYFNDMVNYSMQFLFYQSIFYLCLGIVFIYRNTLQGIGKSVITTLAGVTELIARLLTSFILVKHIGYLGVCLSNPIAWIAADIFLLITYFVTMRKYVGEQTYTHKALINFLKHKFKQSV
ncbi:MAG: MATE family efflux transporter [Candidatus Metalachnospira sp.]|nr:MATE family efflux transporter [Candidatus Metalachnospira sp.]